MNESDKRRYEKSSGPVKPNPILKPKQSCICERKLVVNRCPCSIADEKAWKAKEFARYKQECDAQKLTKQGFKHPVQPVSYVVVINENVVMGHWDRADARRCIDTHINVLGNKPESVKLYRLTAEEIDYELGE